VVWKLDSITLKPEDYVHRLLQLKGKRHVRVTEVPKTYKSLNSGDVFLLDAGTKLYIWQGAQSSGGERVKAAQLAEGIEEERNGLCKIEVIQEGSDDEEFFKLVGDKGPIASAEAGGSDLEADKDSGHLKQLFKITENGSTFGFAKVSEGDKIKKSEFVSKDVFILDTGFEVITWIGKDSSLGEKKHALQSAQDYLTAHGKPPHTPICRMVEGAENDVFNQYVH